MRHVLLLALPLAALLLGCGAREHIRPDYGKHLRSRLMMQRVYTEATEGNPAGLDSEEAALIHGTYRKNMAKESGSPEDKASGRVLILQEDKDAKGK